MKKTIHDSMTVNRHSPQSASGSEGEILVGSVIFSEIARCELVTVGPQQDLDDAQRLQARHNVRRRPVVEANDELIGSVVQRVIALHAFDERREEAVEGTSR
jgi:CBS-domain-containing membrane protein